MPRTHALVLGGVGLTAAAWQTGMLAGLAAEGIDVVAEAERLIGTSAGATVAVQVSAELSWPELLGRQTDPRRQSREVLPHGIPFGEVVKIWDRLRERFGDAARVRRHLGELAASTVTVSERERLTVVADRLPRHSWPDRPLTLVAVNANSGEARLFDRDTGVGLVEAVMASEATPGVWPPVGIDGDRFIDGACRTSTNADLAAGFDRVLVLAPTPDDALPDQVAVLRRAARVLVVAPDDASAAAFGADPFDPSVRGPVADAGYGQGRKLATMVTDLWRAA